MRAGGGAARIDCRLGSRRHDERVMNGFLLKADHFGETEAWQELNVEDFFNGCLEFEHTHDATAVEIDGRHTALELVTTIGNGHSIHCGSRPNLRQPDEGVAVSERPAPRKPGRRHDRFSLPRVAIDEDHTAGARFEDPELAVAPPR